MSAIKHEFKAEVQQLLNLMIHSVYSNRDVFLRELLSNAADALDKARFLSLTRTDLVPAGHEQAGIRITVDKDANTIVIEDDGLGMTEADAIAHLGTIAHSGTKAFFEQAKAAGSSDLPELIGQFGVGFYSSFMVAERVVVDSRSCEPDATPVRWISSGDGSYEVETGDRAIRGTSITLHLREDAAEYADDLKLRGIIRDHSNYLSWPVLIDDEQVNKGKAIWAEPPSEVDDTEANEFYRMLTFDWEEPLHRIHFQVDSPHQYSAMLFIPRSRPYDLFIPDAAKGPRLYARRVMIAEHATDMLPDWLRFVRGVVDSQDIPLNMSREMIQKTQVVRSIRDALVKRILKELGRLANKEVEADEEHPYDVFWKAFGVLIKEGHYHDKSTYGERILPLLRFNTTTHADAEGLTSLAAYKEAMPEGQDAIWYFSASSRDVAMSSPHLEAFRKKGWSVLLLTDPVDEWFIQGLTEVDGVPVKSVSRGELELEDEGEEADKADLTVLGPWMKGVLGDIVASVRPSTRLTDSPAVLVDDQHGISANMERIMRSANQEVGNATRHLELNVRHPLIRDLARLHEQGSDELAEPIARLLLDDAMLLEGTVTDATGIGKRLQAMLERAASQAVRSV